MGFLDKIKHKIEDAVEEAEHDRERRASHHEPPHHVPPHHEPPHHEPSHHEPPHHERPRHH